MRRPGDLKPALPPAPALEPARYTADKGNWADDRLAALDRSKRLAWTIAGVAAGIVVVQAAALLIILPLKQTVPYTITVDRQTGYVQTTPGLTLPKLSESDAVKQSFLTQYVLARETFDLTDYKENYRKTMLWSAGNAAATYQRDWDRANPDGVQARYRATTIVAVTAKQVNLLGPDTAAIRFDTEQTDGNGASGGLRQSWVATVRFKLLQKPLSERDRYLNPLGFQIISYRRDAELPVPVSMPYQPAPQPVPPDPAIAAAQAASAAAAAASAASGASAAFPASAASGAVAP